MRVYFFLLCTVLFQHHGQAAEEVELNACIKDNDVFLITDIHTSDKYVIQQVNKFIDELATLMRPEGGAMFSILGFPKSHAGIYTWTSRDHVQTAKEQIKRNLKDPEKQADMNIPLKQVKDQMDRYDAKHRAAPDSLIVLTHNRPQKEVTDDDGWGEEEDEEKGLNTPDKVSMAGLAKTIQGMAKVYVIAIGPYGDYELTDIASCGKEEKCLLQQINLFDELPGMVKGFLTAGCEY